MRLPDILAAEIEAESQERRIPKSDVVRDRLEAPRRSVARRAASLDAIADLIGSVEGLPPNLSAKKKAYLRRTGYGRTRPR